MISLWDEATSGSPESLEHKFYLIVDGELVWRENETASCLLRLVKDALIS